MVNWQAGRAPRARTSLLLQRALPSLALRRACHRLLRRRAPRARCSPSRRRTAWTGPATRATPSPEAVPRARGVSGSATRRPARRASTWSSTGRARCSCWPRAAALPHLPLLLGRAGDAHRLRQVQLLPADAGHERQGHGRLELLHPRLRHPRLRVRARTTRPATAACGCRSRTRCQIFEWVDIGDPIYVYSSRLGRSGSPVAAVRAALGPHVGERGEAQPVDEQGEQRRDPVVHPRRCRSRSDRRTAPAARRWRRRSTSRTAPCALLARRSSAAGGDPEAPIAGGALGVQVLQPVGQLVLLFLGPAVASRPRRTARKPRATMTDVSNRYPADQGIPSRLPSAAAVRNLTPASDRCMHV